MKRDGYRWTQDFALGDPDGPLERLERTEETGTTVTFYPSPDIFETTVYSYETLATRFREYAFLNKGLTLTIVDERPDRKDDDGNAFTDTFRYDDGLIDYVKLPDRHQGNGAHLGDRGRGRAPGDRRSASRWRCSGTPPTRSRCTPSPTRSTPTRAAPTRRASGPR